MLNDTEELWKIWSGIDLSFQNWHKQFGRVFTRELASLKNSHFNRLLLTKVYNVWVKKVQRSSISWCYRVMQNLKKKWLVVWKMTNWQIFTRSPKVSKLGLSLGPFIQSRKCMSLKFTRVLCVMTMKNDTKFGKELICLFKIDVRNLTNFDPSTQKSQKFGF